MVLVVGTTWGEPNQFLPGLRYAPAWKRTSGCRDWLRHHEAREQRAVHAGVTPVVVEDG